MTNIPHITKNVNKEAPAGGLSALAGGHSLAVPSPCLFSNNSTEDAEQSLASPAFIGVPGNLSKLSSYHKKQAQTLYSNVDRLVRIEAPSINHVAFLTLTFQENITDAKEAYSRFRSFNSHFLAPHQIYGHWVNVKEHQARGAWHFHMIIQLTEDIRTGFDFDQYDEWLKGPRKPGTFPTGNNVLRSLWKELGEKLEGYGFGRIFTLEPIKSNAEAVSRYVGKYVSKQIGSRPESDKGVRLVNYSKGWLKNSIKIAWHNQNSVHWRRKLSLFAKVLGVTEFYQLSEMLGPGWAYRYQDDIINIEHDHHERFTPEPGEYKSRYVYKLEFNKSSTVPVEKRRDHRKKEKNKIKVANLAAGINDYICPELTDFLKDELEKERAEFPMKQALEHKLKLDRAIQANAPINQEPIEVPF